MISKLNPILDKQIKQTFFQLIADINDPKEADMFLKDFFKNDELGKYTKRLAIAYWLRKGRTEENIVTNLRVTKKEVVDVKKTLNSKGIKLAIKYLEAEEFANVWADKIKNLKGLTFK